jgi:hypothetical protein
MLQSMAEERESQPSVLYIWEYMVGTAISQAARSSFQVLYWMCFFGPSWDVDYSVFRFAKVQFKEL